MLARSAHLCAVAWNVEFLSLGKLLASVQMLGAPEPILLRAFPLLGFTAYSELI